MAAVTQSLNIVAQAVPASGNGSLKKEFSFSSTLSNKFLSSNKFAVSKLVKAPCKASSIVATVTVEAPTTPDLAKINVELENASPFEIIDTVSHLYTRDAHHDTNVCGF